MWFSESQFTLLNMKTNLETNTTPYVEVTEASFETEILAANQPVLVDFWAPWCGPCRMIGPVIEELAGEFAGRAKVAKVNVDENPGTAQRYNIASIPALLIFKNGRVVDQVVGLASKRTLATKLEAQLN